jgi:aminoglycoside phosphotransferase (APT) family kinase protein
VDAANIARRFDLGPHGRLSDGPVARGKQGVIWRLDTSDGRWAVKVPFRESSEDDVRLPTAVHEAAHAAGVPTPAVRRTDDGSVWAPVDGVQVRVYEWVDLGEPDPLVDPAAVGAVVAAVHQVRVAEPGPLDAWSQEPVGAERWDALIGDLDAAGAPFAGQLADLRDQLVGLEEWIAPPREVGICHRDLWADNLLATPAGDLCVIDWDNSGAGDPSQELGCALFEFGRTDPGRARALTHAYRDAGGPGRVTTRGDFTMLIAQLGHITEIAARDWLEPSPRSPERSDSVAWVSEVLDDPHTRERLLQLLAWV